MKWKCQTCDAELCWSFAGRNLMNMTKALAVLMLMLATAFNAIVLFELQRQLHGGEVAQASNGQEKPASAYESTQRKPPAPGDSKVKKPPVNEPELRVNGTSPTKPPQTKPAINADDASLKSDIASLAGQVKTLQESVNRLERNELLTAVVKGELIVAIPGSDERLRFVFVPSGTFTMGYSDEDRLRLVEVTGNAFAGHNSKPAVTVAVQRGFFILDRELTRGQFEVFERQPHPLPAAPASKPAADESAKPAEAAPPTEPKPAAEQPAADDSELPVTRTSWRKAQDCCEWLAAETGFKIRLPTEIEWEYAARGPWPQPYPWPENPAATDFPAWSEKSDAGQPRAVDSVSNHDRSWRGAFDLGGNVSEWCLDRYRQDLHSIMLNKVIENQVFEYDPVTTRLVENDLKRSDSDSNQVRTYRGGAFKDQRWNCEVAGRRSFQENEASDAIGFRPVLLIDTDCKAPSSPKPSE